MNFFQNLGKTLDNGLSSVAPSAKNAVKAIHTGSETLLAKGLLGIAAISASGALKLSVHNKVEKNAELKSPIKPTPDSQAVSLRIGDIPDMNE